MVTWNEKDWVITSQSVNCDVDRRHRRSGPSITPSGPTGMRSIRCSTRRRLRSRSGSISKQYGADRMFVQKQGARGLSPGAGQVLPAPLAFRDTLTLAATGIEPQNAFAPSLTSVTASAAFRLQPSFPAPSRYWSLWGTSMGGYRTYVSSSRSAIFVDHSRGQCSVMPMARRP